MWKQLSGRRSSPLSRSGQQRKVNKCQGQPNTSPSFVQGSSYISHSDNQHNKNLPPNSFIKDHESTREAAKKSSGSVSGDASAEEDAILEELAMISSQRSNAEVNMAAIATVETEEEEEERDAFEDMPSPLSLPASGSVHRPIPLLHSAAPRGAGHHQHPRLQALQASSPMPPPSSGQSSLPASTGSSNSGSLSGSLDQDGASAAGGAINSNKHGMSRSISDSTLRRAALHLNLNQSVLPSFTSLQQFKVHQLHQSVYSRILTRPRRSIRSLFLIIKDFLCDFSIHPLARRA
jgi:hypothetical protein